MKGRPSGRYDDAISAVIGVLLIIAIMAVLSGATALMVKFYAKETTGNFPLTMSKQSDSQELMVQKLGWDGEPLYWDDVSGPDLLSVRGCTSVNGQPLDGTDQVSAGDILECDTGDVWIVHDDSNRVVYHTQFGS